nr:MAG TPA: Protein of unknown function (DUF2634) [Caudoviricetes sp.]
MRAIKLKNFEIDVQLKFDDEGKILSGLNLGDTLRQNQALILVLHQGELKERPEVGVGIEDMLLDNDTLYWRSRIREQLELDNQNVDKVRITTGGIEINASY